MTLSIKVISATVLDIFADPYARKTAYFTTKLIITTFQPIFLLSVSNQRTVQGYRQLYVLKVARWLCISRHG